MSEDKRRTAAMLVGENDPEALAELIRPHLDDPDLGLRQGRAARDRAVERYSAPVVAHLFDRARGSRP